MRHTFARFVGFALCSLLPLGAGAVVINTLNSPAAFTLSYDAGGGLILNASGSLAVTSGFNTSSLTLHVVLSNQSTLNGSPVNPTSARLSGFGFGIDPNATGVTFSDAADGGVIDATLDQIPSLSSIEICAWGGNNCSGGANGGVLGGAYDSFDLILAGNWGGQVTIDPLGVKFQTGIGSFEFACTGACTSGVTYGGLAAVPEPQSLALVGLGLLAAGAIGRRRRSTASL